MSLVEKRNHYRRKRRVLGYVIDKWDPYGLLSNGAPPDEFNIEIAAIMRRFSEIRSPQDAARVVSEVFSYYFSADDFPLVDCLDVGHDLYEALRREEFVP